MKARLQMHIMPNKLLMGPHKVKMILIHFWRRKIRIRMGIGRPFNSRKTNWSMILLLPIFLLGLIRHPLETQNSSEVQLLVAVVVVQWEIHLFKDKGLKLRACHVSVKLDQLIINFQSIHLMMMDKSQLPTLKLINKDKIEHGLIRFGTCYQQDGPLSDGSLL